MTRPGGRIVMGNWIPNDPTLVAQILQDQLGVLAAAAGGLRQPDDLGRRGASVIERFAAAGVPRRRNLVRARHLPRSTFPARRPSSSRTSATTTGRR